MSRARRVRCRHGFYLIEHGTPECPVFKDVDDYVSLYQCIPLAMRPSGVRIQAYCLLPWTFYLVLQVSEKAVGDFMRPLMRQYMAAFNKHHRTNGTRVLVRYRQLLIEPRQYLLRLIRYVTWLSELKAVAPMANYPHSSHPMYLGQAHTPWLTTATVLRKFGGPEADALDEYKAFMAQRPSEEDIANFELDSNNQKLVLGEPCATLDDVIRLIASDQQISAEEMLLTSRRSDVEAARNLVAQYALEYNIATQEEIDRRFGRAPAPNRRKASHLNIFSMWQRPDGDSLSADDEDAGFNDFSSEQPTGRGKSAQRHLE